MKRQRNTAQMKKQGRNSQDDINKEGLGKLPKKAFRIIIVKMFQSIKNRMDIMQEAINTINTINDINRHLPLIQSRMLLIANIVGKSLKWSNGLIQSHISDNGSDRGTIFSNSYIKIPWTEEPGRL